MKTATFIAVLAAIALSAPFSALAKSPLEAGKKRDQRTPIEVSADALEVLQEENKAIFSGHVVAIQADLRLTADNMTVYYNPNANKAAKGKGKNENNAIKKIEALGGVFLSTPEETASGTRGVYDVEAQEIRLTGKVVLTRGKNTLEGESLVYNFGTGKSKIVSASAEPGTGGEKKRVRALFVPEKESAK
ncbi:MAG: lipopolysaccharide transport periplasmic protein LptA [Proteobacteria bacterium]|nr:lipopolysaccharide transport periplasmic protein LptA [Pseudomonadota bacterium]